MENSTTILQFLENLARAEGKRADVPISELAQRTGISITSLISILTELEQRDEIILELNSRAKPGDSTMTDGTVRLMKAPPDEQV